MGLSYDAGESAALAGALSANLTAATAVLDATDSACAQLGEALAGGELSGKGYSAVDTLFEQIIRPSVVDARGEIDAIREDLEKYAQADSFVAPFGVLKEDELNTQLRATKAQRDATERQIESNQTAAAASSTIPGLAPALEASNAQLELVLAQLDATVRDLEGRLQALNDFAARTAGLFVDRLANLAAATGDTVSLLDQLKGSLVLGSVGTGLGAALTRQAILDQLAGNKIARDAEGRLKYGGRFLYKPASGHLYGRGKDFNAATKTRIDHYKKPLKAGGRGFAADVVDDFKGWKGASKLTKASKGLGLVGTGLSIGANVNKYFGDGDATLTDWRDFSIDTAVDVGSGAAAAGIGAAIGSFILPPLGTVVGAGLGIFFNWVANEIPLGDKTAVEWAKEGVKNALDGLAARFW
ncbi:hypothetical protein ABCS02_03460 [Microbacterium sp. X-17]|uniref:hypothetical protein n=1 Tax=Microbacterium sp. X-17 TaxID=3144404 RepID=UPI0031F504EF